MLAELDAPPSSRLRDLLVGVTVAIPVAAAVFGWLIPAFVGAVLGGANNLDDALREQEAYMQQLCDRPQLPRDEDLCGCVFSVEFPALDCQDKFRPWLVERAAERCDDDALAASARSFCVCAEVIAEDLTSATNEEDAEAARKAGQGMDRCFALPDALSLEAIYASSSSP